VGRLINIDNGGTLTDVCVIDGDCIVRTKTLTTPHDLSRCFVDGLTKAAEAIYGAPDLVSLLRTTDHIRYSTTQGTNSLVERKGPRLGIILSGTLSSGDLRTEATSELFDALVGDRVEYLDTAVDPADLALSAVRAVNALTSAGSNRVVVIHGGHAPGLAEWRVKNILLAKFPQHLLGAVPLLYSHEVAEDDDDGRRAWTALFNAYLHKAMENFLYNAEHKLQANKNRNPLLIFRNDGQSARVAKTTALKTYSSGPRGGVEGARAIAAHYGFPHLLSMDVGGTTTDIGEIVADQVRVQQRGLIGGIETSFPLCDIVSVGVGGSSVISVEDGRIRVGPQSMGSAPGPACFGLGGKRATITDAFLLSGLLDPTSFFGGELKLDRERAAAAIAENVAGPLGITETAAVAAMEDAWVSKIAESLSRFTSVTAETTLAAFGGAGPLAVCRVAEAAGIDRVLIPGLAAVFSAYGLGFSDIGHRYEARLDEASGAALESTMASLLNKAERDMFAEGFDLADCQAVGALQIRFEGREETLALDGIALETLPQDASLSVVLTVVKAIPHPRLLGAFSPDGTKDTSAVTETDRTVLLGGHLRAVPLYEVESQSGGATAPGPAVLEEAYFTSRIDDGWRFEVSDLGDILLSRS